MSSDIPTNEENVVLRLAGPSDDPVLRQLAERDSSTVPAGTLLVAEIDGIPRAAYSASERRAIADPFRPTAHLVEMLELHADNGWADPEDHADPRLRGLLERSAPWPA